MTLYLDKPCVLLIRSSSGATDDYGGEIETEETVSTVCYLEQRSSSEPGGAGELGVGGYMALIPRDAPELSTGDAIVVDGAVYELTGPPALREAPAGWALGRLEHFELSVRRTAGSEEVGS